MRRSLWMWMPMIAAVSLAGACKDGKSDDDTDTPDVEDTVDSAPSYPEMAGFSFTALFGYDPDTDSAIQVTGSNGPIPIQIIMNIGEDSYFQTGNGDNCSIFVVSGAESIARGTWATAEAGLLFGFDFSDNLEIDDTECLDVFDPADIQAVVDGFADGVWFAGLHENIDAEILASFASGGVDSSDMLGGMTFINDGAMTAEGYDATYGFASGFAIDDANAVIVEGGQPAQLTKDEILVGSALGKGWYQVNLAYYFFFQ